MALNTPWVGYRLGGYVHLFNTQEIDRPLTADEQQQAFDKQPLLTRIAVICAGPGINLLFAVLAYWFIFVIGIQGAKPLIGWVLPHSIAAQAGLSAKQEMTEVDGYSVKTWRDVALAVALRLGEKEPLIVKTRPYSPRRQLAERQYQLDLKHWRIDTLRPQLLESLGIKPFHPPVPPIIDKIKKRGPAAQGGLKVGDRILSVNGHAIHDWVVLSQFIRKHPRTTLTF